MSATRDGSRPICGRYFKASVVIMTPSHAFGALGRQPCSYRHRLVIAVGEPRCKFSQVALPDWLTVRRTERLRAECPAIHQDEFHPYPSRKTRPHGGSPIRDPSAADRALSFVSSR